MSRDELREAVARAIYEAEPTTGHDDDEKPFIVPWSDIADQWTGYPATYEAMITLADAALREAIPRIERETAIKALRDAAAECRKIQTETTFAANVSDDHKKGFDNAAAACAIFVEHLMAPYVAAQWEADAAAAIRNQEPSK